MWQNVLKKLPTNIFGFVRKSLICCLPNKSNLFRWKLVEDNLCSSCNHVETQLHVLSHCTSYLQRYTWRHDNVLISIHKDLLGLVQMVNRRNATRTYPAAPPIRFVKKGARNYSKPNNFRSILDANYTSDWQINFDFFGKPTIPGQAAVDTNLRPDIVIFSLATKTLLWFEETVPLERNVVDAAIRKEARYAKLKTTLILKGWSVHDFTFEIGALGFVSKSFNYMLIKLGFPNTQKKFIRKRVSKLALRSSFTIW